MIDTGDLRRQIAELEWYHTLDLAPGITTPGWFDTRQVPLKIPMPASLEGCRCLDIGTFDGFWAFEMERRGGEVTAVDVIDPMKWDWPVDSEEAVVTEIARRKSAGRGFELARAALGSRVNRELVSVYDLDAVEIGTFDFVYLGSLLLHLRDPVRALERVRSVCRGTLLVVDAIDLEMSLLAPRRPVAELDGLGRPWWWRPSVAGLVRMIMAGGFELVRPAQRVYMPPGADQPIPALRPRMLLSAAGRTAAITRWRGEPHAAVLARPRNG